MSVPLKLTGPAEPSPHAAVHVPWNRKFPGELGEDNQIFFENDDAGTLHDSQPAMAVPAGEFIGRSDKLPKGPPLLQDELIVLGWYDNSWKVEWKRTVE